MAFEREVNSLRAAGHALGLAVVLLAAGSASVAQAAQPQETVRPKIASVRAAAVDEAGLKAILTQTRAKYRIPGMTAAVLQDEQTVIAVDGLRQAKTTALVTAGDRWHLGSCGKAMTATLSARLVERGLLSWDTELSQAFPELQGVMRVEYVNVTLRDLLAHRGGFPESLPKKLATRLKKFRGTPAEAREFLLPELLKLRPAGRPGVNFVYSNVGYSIVAVMLERYTEFSYEELMDFEVFQPLGMTTAGFGEPRSAAGPDEPVGHTAKGKPLPSTSPLTPPAAGNPAGLIHMSMADWSRFAAIHLDESGSRGYLSTNTLNFLHQAFPGSTPRYALGWLRLTNGTDNILAHNGSNGYWYSVIALIPGRNLALMIACNQGGKKADKATLEVINAIATSLGITLPPSPI